MASPRRTERWFQQLVGDGDMSRRRREYAALREKHNTDPRGDAGDPLMATEGSSWASYFATQEVRKTIVLDLERLHPGDDFFASGDVQGALLDILTVWALENQSVGYRQGMHELASLVLSSRATDVLGLGHAWGSSSAPPNDPVIDGAPELSASYVEHDTYGMFCAMLGKTRVANPDAPQETTPIRVVAFFEDAPNKAGFDKSEVKRACDRVFRTLGAVDPPLQAHLVKLGVEPQLFLLRWFRVLFSREFHFDDAMKAWSAFFGQNELKPKKNDEKKTETETEPSGTPRDLIEAFAVAMVIFLRENILASDDFGTVLRRLQKFPPVENINHLIERALAIAPAVGDPRVSNASNARFATTKKVNVNDSLSPEILGVFGSLNVNGVPGAGTAAGPPEATAQAAREAAREMFNKAKETTSAGQKRAGELFKATKGFVGSLMKDSSSFEHGFRRQVSVTENGVAEGKHGEGFEIGERRAAPDGPGDTHGRPIAITASPGGGGIGIGWIGGGKQTKTSSSEFANVSLDDQSHPRQSPGPMRVARRAPSTTRRENLKALEVSVANVTAVLASGTVTDSSVESSLRDVQASLTRAITAMRE